VKVYSGFFERFVLEHKIEELRQQILPKDGVIIDLRSQIDAMEDELNTVTRYFFLILI